MKPDNFLAVTNGTTGTASFVSSAFWLWSTVKISGQAVVSSGSFVGTFAFQFSNDLPVGAPPSQFQPTNWNSIGSTTQVTNCSTSATAKSFLIPQFETSYSYARVVYTDLSAAAAIGTFNFTVKTLAL